MAEGKKSFILYTDLVHTVSKMPMEKRGELFTAILEYVNDMDPVTDDILVDLVFEPIKRQMKRDLDKYRSKVEHKSVSGREGNLKRWNEDIYDEYKAGTFDLEEAEAIAKDRKVSHPDPPRSVTIANIADTVNDTVNDTVTVNDTDTDIKKKELRPLELFKEEPEEIYTFEEFWIDYERVGNKKTAIAKWKTKVGNNAATQQKIKDLLPLYLSDTVKEEVKGGPWKKRRMIASRFLNDEEWMCYSGADIDFGVDLKTCSFTDLPESFFLKHWGKNLQGMRDDSEEVRPRVVAVLTGEYGRTHQLH